MKKKLVFALSAIAALGTCFTSCDSAPSSKVALQTDNDSLSYAYGAALYEQGLSMYVMQMGITTDTASINAAYSAQIGAEEDAAKKASLSKEMRSKIDSTSRANQANLAQFLKGLKDGIASNDSQQKYNSGLSIGNEIASRMMPTLLAEIPGGKMNKDAIVAAIVSGIKNETPIMTNSTAFFEQKMKEVQESKLEEKYGANRDAGVKFLEENKAKAGITTLPSGVQYEILKEGKGAKPTAEDQVTCHYHGTLIDGTVFDSSINRGEPASFAVMGVIPGWTEILQLMPVGSKWKVYIPYDKAYGTMDRGELKPYSALVFEIELLEIAKK